MNIYIIVEGEVGEAKVYRKWVPLVNPSLSFVSNIFELENNNFAIISGGGYPQYFEIIEAAIDDVNNLGIVDRLVISVDSEDMSYNQKYTEIQPFITNQSCNAQIHIIIQHFCPETWALGNQVIIRRNFQNEQLRQYIRFYDVRLRDPELLPGYQPQQIDRVRFAEIYLRRALNERYRNLSYSKHNPTALLHNSYFERVKQRYELTDHIATFEHFLTAFL